MEGRGKIKDRYVQLTFVDSGYGRSCATGVAVVIFIFEGEAIVTGEGTQPPAHFVGTPLTGGKIAIHDGDRLATSREGRENVGVGCGVWMVGDTTGRWGSIDIVHG